MPGFLYHLALSEQVLKSNEELNTKSFRTDFLLGSIIPSLAKDTDRSHYRGGIHVGGWKIPGLSMAKHDLLDNPTPLLLGVYCHLWFDYYFILYYLAQRYTVIDGNRVIDTRTGFIWKISDFLSKEGLYGAYAQGNNLLTEHNLLPSELFTLPQQLPMTGIDFLDDRVEGPWLDMKMHQSIRNDPTINDSNIFTSEELEKIILDCAKRFAKELRYVQS